jgi:tryptophanyl-tRNA synthetase
MIKQRILSGMRPTGKLHLGHLVGALENWVKLQSEYDCFYMVADWHALMSEYEDSSHLAEYSLDNVTDWLACGIDPERSVIFRQSDISQHAELQLVFSCITPLGWLERCPTYKEQLTEITTRDLTTYAFLGYPVLQAADILLYKGNAVPVGEDQLPHLELAREIVRRFHHLFKCDIFPEPKALLTKTPRLLGLDKRKMSKSYGNVINLSDPIDGVAKKIQTMFTDPKRIKRNDPGHPEECNLFDYYKVFAPDRAALLMQECKVAKQGCVDCKKELANIVAERLKPIQAKRSEIEKDKDYVNKILKQGADKAGAIASQTMAEVKKAIALI